MRAEAPGGAVIQSALERRLQRYETAPHLVFWETTKACALSCRHCRASAQLTGLPGELSTAEGRDLIDQVAALGGSPILILTGGDCLERSDLDELIAYARQLGIHVGLSPSVTPRLTLERLAGLHELGVRSLSISLDGSEPATHDGIRGISGLFERTVAVLPQLVEMGFRVQVNTTVMSGNVLELADVVGLLRRLGISIWEVFFLVGVGRGIDLDEVGPDQAEDVCHFLVDVTTRGMTVRTVEAPFFRRVQAARRQLGGPPSPEQVGPLYATLHRRLEELALPAARPAASHSLATGDGRGIVFVGHDGAVLASGFLPVPLGNIRERDLASIYAKSPILAEIRAGRFSGACGHCEVSQLCGGSRARAYAHSGDVLGEDPACVRSDGARSLSHARSGLPD
ncbi:MAG: TIGR04053 family radical SAM/SPASM domain-containing protein [Acidimicrobiales bacterium]